MSPFFRHVISLWRSISKPLNFWHWMSPQTKFSTKWAPALNLHEHLKLDGKKNIQNPWGLAKYTGTWKSCSWPCVFLLKLRGKADSYWKKQTTIRRNNKNTILTSYFLVRRKTFYKHICATRISWLQSEKNKTFAASLYLFFCRFFLIKIVSPA